MQKILIIEDEKDICDTIVDIVRYSGYDCMTLADGVQAAEAALEYKPDLIICDILLPNVDGYGVILEMQKTPATKKIPFIFLTAKATYADIRKGMALGADDYLTKPFTAEQLVTAISKRLSRFEMISGLESEKNEYFKDFLKMTLPHELRTPMSGIMGYLSLLTEGFDEFEPAQIKAMLERMNVATKRLYHIVENYILFAQLTTTLTDPELASKLREYSYCLEGAEIISFQAEQKALEYHRLNDLHLDVSSTLLRINPESLEKLIAELVDNAFKFSATGQPVRVTSHIDDDGKYQLQIADHGRGMSEKQLFHIDALNQFDRAKFEQQGMGLGLALSQKIADLIGGSVHVQSVPGEGTTVIVCLPIRDEIPQFSDITFSLIN